MNIKSPTAYKTIGEVSKLLDIPTHVLRFWEKKFKQISPYKNNNRRYYSSQNIDIIRSIKFLLYEKGFTINGVKTYLTEKPLKTIVITPNTNQTLSENTIKTLKNIVQTIKHIKSQLQYGLEK